MDYLYSINSSAVSLKPPYKLDESQALYRKQLYKRMAQFADVPAAWSYFDNESFMQHLETAEQGPRMVGVPQGAATSTTLATILLKNSVFRIPWYNHSEARTLMYADDGLFYGDIKEEFDPIPVMEHYGIEFNRAKSG